jgi:hypothetical protein
MLRLLVDENYNGRILRALKRQIPDLDVVRTQDTPLLGVGRPCFAPTRSRRDEGPPARRKGDHVPSRIDRDRLLIATRTSCRNKPYTKGANASKAAKRPCRRV